MINGKCIRNFRRFVGMTQKQFADKIGVNIETVQRAEKNTCLTTKTIIKICEAFDIKANILDGFPNRDITGEQIRTLRKRKGWSQEQLAFECDTSQTAITLYENDMVTPRPRTQWKILKVLGEL